MQEENIRFLIDTNVFIAAIKRSQAKTRDLLLYFLTNLEIEIVANEVLLGEYEKYAEKLNAKIFYEFLKRRITFINPSDKELKVCKPYFSDEAIADLVHAATCLKTGAILITNDKDFNKIKRKGLIEVWSISEAIKKLLR